MNTTIKLVIPLMFAAPVFALDIWVWTTEEVSLNMNVVSVNGDHPCGSTSQIDIEGFPASDAASEIGFEKVTEYSENEIINQWSVPIDKYVIAVESDSIYVPYLGRALRLHTDGTYQLADTPVYENKPIGQCPGFIVAEYSGSDYVQCIEYIDLESKNVRTIALEGPCT